MKELARRADPRALFDEEGALPASSVGFARSSLGPVRIRGHRLRKKRWDYWCVTSPTCAVAFVVADVDYLGLAAVTHFDFASRTMTERASVLPLGRGAHLADDFDEGAWHASPGLSVRMVGGASGTALSAHGSAPWAKTIDARVHVAPPDETLNVAVPFRGGGFQINAKHAARRAAGEVRVGGRAYPLGPSAFAAYYGGRRVWPWRTRWNWACVSGELDGRTVGINLGGAWTDGSGATENGITVGGKLHVIGEDLVWTYDRGDFTRPWRIVAPTSQAVDLVATPFWHLHRGGSAGVLGSELDFVWARFEGTVRTSDGETLRVPGWTGWAEQHVARW